MTEQDNQELFDAYERGSLSAGERDAFEKQLAENNELKKAFDQYIQQIHVLKAIGIRDEVASFFDEREERKTKRIHPRYILPLAAAAAISLILIFRPATTVDHNTLFERHFSPYPDAITGRATSMSIDDAMQLYNMGQYEEALDAFNVLGATDTISFYKGMSHLALKEAQASIKAFAQIPRESLFYSPSIWYKGLAFLLSDQKDSTQLYMLKIKPNQLNYEAAQEVFDFTKSR